MTGGADARQTLGILAAIFLFFSTTAAVGDGFEPITLRATKIDSFGTEQSSNRFGTLEFRGGLDLASDHPDFGGISGIDYTPDGRLVAVTDTGFWFTARTVEKDGHLIDLVETEIAPILGKNGQPLVGKRVGDAEGLRISANNGTPEALVSFENRNDVRRFVAAPEFANAHAIQIPLPKSVRGVKKNAGFESLAIAPEDGPLSGAIVLIAERSLNRDGNHRAWAIGGPRSGTFSITRDDEFDVTDAAFLPNSDLLVLERSFSLVGGIGMRIRRIAAADLLPGQTVDGRVLIEADGGHQIDNMEGMALHPGANGETMITLISDNNHMFFQRTLLLQFALPPDDLPRPRMRADSIQ